MDKSLESKISGWNSQKQKAFRHQFLSAFAALWTCLSHGLLTGYSAQAIPSLAKQNSYIHLSSTLVTWMCCIVPLMSVISASMSCPLCVIIGRRLTMLSACIPLSTGWMVVAFAINSDMILVGRAMCGVTSSIALPAAYTYVAEISSSSNRGFFGSLMSVGWSCGLVISYAVGSLLEWNTLALFCAFIPMIQFFSLLFCHSSPRWLVSRLRFNEAKEALMYLRGGAETLVEEELSDCENQNKSTFKGGTFLQRIKMMFGPGHIRRAIVICLSLYFFTVFTGFSVITYHAKMILLNAKVAETIDANVGCIIIGLCKVGGNIFSAFIIDRVGRKILLYISSVLICIAHTLLGTYFYLQREYPEGPISDYHWAPLALLILYMVSFPIGWGSVTYVLVSELVPTAVRPETAVLCNSWEQLLMFVTLQLKAQASNTTGLPFLYWTFAATSAFGAFVVWKFLPETSGKTLEEIGYELMPLIEKNTSK